MRVTKPAKIKLETEVGVAVPVKTGAVWVQARAYVGIDPFATSQSVKSRLTPLAESVQVVEVPSDEAILYHKPTDW